MSDQPKIAAASPAKVHLEPGKTYAYCTCGESLNQPMCDGSHGGTGFKPQLFTVEAESDAFLCRCKRTGNAPYCDGTHNTL